MVSLLGIFASCNAKVFKLFLNKHQPLVWNYLIFLSHSLRMSVI